MRISFLLIMIFAFTLKVSGQEAKQEGVYTLTLEELMNLDVFSSNKKIEGLIETPAAINVVTAEEIKMLNFNTLEQVLEYSVGLASINGEGNIFTTTTIRGNTLVNYNTNTLLLFDGIPLFNAYDGSFDLQAIPLSSIERVEIVKGSNSVLYGSNAVNGVINIISKTPDDEENLLVDGRIKYGSFNTVSSNVGLTKKSGDWQYALFTDYVSSSGEELHYIDEQGNELNLDKKYKAFSTASKISYKNLSLDLLYYNRALPNVRTRGFQKIYTSMSDTIGMIKPEYSDESSIVVNLAYVKDFSDKVTMNFRSNFMHWNLEKEFVDGYWDYFSNGLYNDLDFNIKTNEKFSNKLGVSYNHYLGRRYKSQNDAYDIGKDKVWTDDIALFINGEYEIAKPLKVFYGGRFYYAKYGDTDFSNFSPRLALTYSINKNLYVKAIYGQSFRIPTYFEKEVESNSVIGNPDLLPEQSTSYDFVISSIVKGVQFDVGFFHTEINDRILRVSSPDDPNLKTNLNTGSIILTGAELNSKFRLKDKIFGFFGYSYTQGKDLETNEDLQYVYDNMVNFGANLKLANWISASTSLKYLSNWGAADAYTLINLGMSLQPSNEMPIEIEFKIDNIFDTDVYLPEIARRSEAVPVIPKTLNRMFFVGASFRF